MKNHCCETCYNTCKEVSCNVCVELKTCQCSQNFCLFSERTQQFSEEEIESFIAKNYSKIALVVFKNYVKSRKLDLILQILSYVEKTNIYEQPNNQAKVLTIVPYQTFNITLEQIREHKLDIEEMQLIVKWFKNTFFHWVEDHCLNCGSKSLRRENGVPNQQEEQHMAGRVEVMICNSCKTIRRFPRYNDPVKLLETRVGRCGEYANCFTFICRSLGYTARLVLDTTDHVWTEFYSRNEQRYVCVDPAEGKVDFPMTYERGWGKKLQYCFGINAHEVVDVTKRYTERYNECLTRRTKINETILEDSLDALNIILSSKIQRFENIEKWRIEERDELLGLKKVERKWEAIGRISGSQAWKNERNESGTLPNKEMYNTLVSTQYCCVGDAKYMHEYIEITNGKQSRGGIWTEIKCKEVMIKFNVKNINAKADGFAVVLQSDGLQALGNAGSGKGYESIHNGIVVEFSLYCCEDNHDPNAQHVAIIKQNKQVLTPNHLHCVDCCLSPQPYWDGQTHLVEVIFTQSSICCWIDGVATSYMADQEVMQKVWCDRTYVGITGGTGGLPNTCHVMNYGLYTTQQ